MSEAQCVRYPIKPGRKARLVDWIASLRSRRTELAEAFAEGGIQTEAVFLEKSDDGDQLLIYTSAEDLDAANRALASSRLPLVREFNELLAQSVDTEGAVSLEVVFHTP